MALPNWLRAILRMPQTAQGGTPPYNPNAGAAGQPAANSGIDWAEILPYLVNAGTNVAGTALQARAQNQGNEYIRERTAMMDKLAREEQARRDFYAKMLLPNLMRGTGWSKEGIAQQMQQLPYNQTTTATPGPAPTAAPQQGAAPLPEGWTPDLNNPIHRAALKNKYKVPGF